MIVIRLFEALGGDADVVVSRSQLPRQRSVTVFLFEILENLLGLVVGSMEIPS